MNIVVVNAYVRGNAGDAALLSVCLRHIREAFPGARVEVAGMEDATVHPSFEGAANLGSIRRYVADGEVSRLRRIVRRLAAAQIAVAYLVLPVFTRSLLLRLLPAEARREAAAVLDADLVVSMGGGYLLARPGLDGYQNIFFVLLPVLLAQLTATPVVFAPQSFGPFPARSQRWLVRRTLHRAALVLAREDVSVNELRDCGLPERQIRRAVDAGFAFAPSPSTDWRALLGLDREQPLVGVTARRWLDRAGQDRYERALAETIDTIQADGVRVVLIPQVSTDYLGDDDRIVESRIAAHCTSVPLRVDDRVDYREIKSLYDECTFLIGTRFHSVIFSLTGGVPCIAIEYEHKTRGIMADLGLAEWVLPIAEVTYARLMERVTALQAGEEEYRAVLQQRVPAYVGDAERFPDLLRTAVAAGREVVEAGAAT
ncbi:polysaccharide pyruvyl transferase family protein [Kitasatospora sp. MAP5-34]|uniref:polysaccharide pyruvyl transferase family protein n=1 Tax=Kitasatospora sp. MAP5-34 TaxID=3035102 RepID=UPI0024747808|nr:polysaccharide pyruvyl transferase family protein [Kitasatospora sp. MAP5-34]MDH6578063.1 colanic acid/amylovoran biosynthesis protein [Kitasatospora sp. MAP5-34]